MDQNSGAADLLRSEIKENGVTYLQVFFIVFSIVTYIADYILDIILAFNHYKDGNIWFFVLTVCSVAIPALILTAFNTWWYKTDGDIDTSKVSIKLWIIRIFFIVLLMAPFLRNFEALYYAIRSMKSRDEKEKEEYYLRMISFSTDAAILTVFDAFMEGGPQVVLQTCIFAQLQVSNPNIFTITEMWQIATIVLALFSMSASYATYQRYMRLSLNDRGMLNIPTMIYVIVWRFLDIMSRVIALGLFASIFPYYLILISCVHFFVMFVWIRTMKTDFYKDKMKEFIYNLVLGEIFVFFYFNPKDEPTRQRYTIYYILIFLENTALIFVWYYYYSPDIHFRFPALILHFSSFVVATVLMVIYYYFLHPTRGRIAQKFKTEEKPSETEMTHYEPNVNADENENMKLNTEETSAS